MIYPLPTAQMIYYETVREDEKDMIDFLDRIQAIIEKYKNGIFVSEEKRKYRAKILARNDVYKSKTLTDNFGDQEITYTISTRRYVMFKILFEEIFE